MIFARIGRTYSPVTGEEVKCHTSQDVMDYVEQCDPDLVMVVYNPGVFEPHNFGMFDFVR